MRWPASWLWLLLGSLCAVGLSDALLMGLSTGYFAGGFNTAYLDGTGRAAVVSAAMSCSRNCRLFFACSTEFGV